MCELEKVCHVTRRFVKSRWGGIESAVLRLSQELEKAGVESPIFSTSMLAHSGPDSIESVSIRRFPYVFPWFFLGKEAKRQMALKGGSPMSVAMLWALLTERRLTVIHTHVQNRLGGIARTVARLRRIPYVVTVHAGYHTLPKEQSLEMMRPFSANWEWGKIWGYLLGSRRTFQDADAIICVGLDEYELMRDRFPEKSVYYLPNGVDVEHFRRADPDLFRQRFGLKSGERLLLCVSRIDPQKNQRLLLDAFAALNPIEQNLHLALVGPVTDNSYAKDLLLCVEAYGLKERVHWITGLEPDDPLLSSAYRSAELFVLPSVHEPFGIVILEAWAAGVPVVASQVGGIPGFTRDGVDALLFPTGNQSALETALQRLLGDERLRSELVRGGAHAVQRYDWSLIAKETVEVYKGLLSKGG